VRDNSNHIMKKIILLVDDDRAMVDLLATLFLQNGWLPMRAMCGEEAIAAIVRTVPDAVICDLNMAGISGFEVAAQLRKSCGIHCPALVAFTACCDRDIGMHAMEAGFNAVVAKPAEFDKLMSAVKMSLKVNRRAHQKSVTEHHKLPTASHA